MNEGSLARIDEFLTSLGWVKPTVQVVRSAVPTGSSREVIRSKTSAHRPHPWGTAGVEDRLPPTPSQMVIVERIVQASRDLDPDAMYVWSLLGCRAMIACTNHTIEWDDVPLAYIDWYSRAWVATVEMAKVVRGYTPVPTEELAGENWKKTDALREEIRPIVDQARAEWAAQGGEVWP